MLGLIGAADETAERRNGRLCTGTGQSARSDSHAFHSDCDEKFSRSTISLQFFFLACLSVIIARRVIEMFGSRARGKIVNEGGSQSGHNGRDSRNLIVLSRCYDRVFVNDSDFNR